MISVAEALDHIFSLVAPLPDETVPLRAAAGRRLARPMQAARTQPPFDAAVMDGYAVPDTAPERGQGWTVIGEAAAGHPLDRRLGPGQAARIFTGAPLPDGATRVLIQEDIARDGDAIRLAADPADTPFVRPRGYDFVTGDRFDPDRPLTPADLALLAAMGHAELPVIRRPDIAIIATGDELVPPGTPPGPGQIVASNQIGLAAMAEAAGATVRLLPIARDTSESLSTAIGLARGADLVVTIGGASVGDHDIVAATARDLGLDRAFYRVAMRPGKPLMAGRLSDAALIGLPGNPVSAMVCGTIFMVPAIRVLQGAPPRAAPRHRAALTADLPANGPREHYMRATATPDGVRPFDDQDSSLLSTLARADRLVVRPPHDPARTAGEMVETIRLGA